MNMYLYILFFFAKSNGHREMDDDEEPTRGAYNSLSAKEPANDMDIE